MPSMNIHFIKSIRRAPAYPLDPVSCPGVWITKIYIQSGNRHTEELELNLFSDSGEKALQVRPMEDPKKQASCQFTDVELEVCGVTCKVDFDFDPGEPATRDDPGCPGDVMIDCVWIGSENMTDFLTESFKAVLSEKAIEHGQQWYEAGPDDSPSYPLED